MSMTHEEFWNETDLNDLRTVMFTPRGQREPETHTGIVIKSAADPVRFLLATYHLKQIIVYYDSVVWVR